MLWRINTTTVFSLGSRDTPQNTPRPVNDFSFTRCPNPLRKHTFVLFFQTTSWLDWAVQTVLCHSIINKTKCNYSLSGVGLTLCSRGCRAALSLNPRLLSVKKKNMSHLFLWDFISYTGFAEALLTARFGCRCVHLTSCCWHVLTKLLWNSEGLTASADTQTQSASSGLGHS